MLLNKAIIKKKEAKYMARIPQAEIAISMKELSATAFKLLMYYYSRRDGWRFNDKYTAEAIDSSERMVKTYRKELITKKYLLVQKGEVDVYFVGTGAVAQFYEEVGEDVMDEVPSDPIIVKTNKQ